MGTFGERKRERQFWDIIHGYLLSIVKIKREIEREQQTINKI